MDQLVKSSYGLIEAVKVNPDTLFEYSEKFDEIFDALCAELRQRHADIGTDVSTKSKRDEIISAAYEVTLIKGRIEKAGKARNDPLNAEIKSNNRMRKRSETDLEAMSKELRLPVTKWEAQEKARKESHEAIIQELKIALRVDPAERSSDIARRLERVQKINTSRQELQEFAAEAQEAQDAAVGALSLALDRAKQAEENARELAALKAEKAEREAAELKAEKERKAAERKAELERQAKEREAEIARQAEEAARKRAEAEAEERERRRLAAEQEERAERERRARDRENRANVIAAMASKIEALAGIERHQAEVIADALAAGDVPHVRVEF